MTRTITIVGKGPSAVHAQEWINACPGTDVCSINEAAMILRPDQPVRFLFFCHAQYAVKTQPLWSRVETFVSPSEFVGKEQGLPGGFPRHKHLRYVGNACGASRTDLLERINSGHPAHHHTIPAAMSWLAKVGYRRLRIIGVGGNGYASGFTDAPTSIGDDWVDVEKTLAALLADLYGVETERFGE